MRIPLRSLLVVIVILVLQPGCGSKARSGFDSLRAGMTEAQVRELLGEPSVVIPGEAGEDGAVISGPRWQYGDNLSTITTAAVFPRTVPQRVWAVWFGTNGEVLTWRAPILNAASSVESSTDDGGGTPLFVSPAPSRDR
ncbi:MAG: hypothetical protein CMJ23_00695 [Phycisphaerae bacterium]|nr:hypothetical protein [Phycisphaerae bacterium]